METQFKSAVEEKQITVLELKNLNLKTDESACALNNEITKLKDLNGQYLSQLNEVSNFKEFYNNNKINTCI